MIKCPFCKPGILTRKTRKKLHTQKNKTIKIDQPAYWCNKCKNGVLSKIDLKEPDRQIRDFHSRENGLLTSSEIKEIRSRLKLTQKEAARICGGGPNAFCRYERGEATPIRATSNLLRLLDKYPIELVNLSRS